MEEYARGSAKNNVYCFTPDKTKSFIVDYLGLKTQTKTFVKLEDFI